MRAMVLGWYDRGNLGDQAFKPALHKVLPNVELAFTNHVKSLNGFDALIVGGGSFLDQPLQIDCPVNVPTAFIGVGIHGGVVHPDNVPLLKTSRALVARNLDTPTEFSAIHAPDLLFARTDLSPTAPVDDKRLLVLPNGFAIPKRTSPAWAVLAWQNFEVAMARVLDEYQRDGWTVHLQPMCASEPCHSLYDDRFAAARLIGMCQRTERLMVGMQPLSEAGLIREISEANLILSARLHGSLFAAMLGRRFVGISAHDKIRSFFSDNDMGSSCVDFYTFSMGDLQRAIEQLPSETDLKALRSKGDWRWTNLSGYLEKTLSS